MTKFIPDVKTMSVTEDTPAAQTTNEFFNSFLNAPVTKLDADEYMAKDLDGVTESLLGSGNLNFLMMQAGQTDEAMVNSNPFNIQQNDLALAPLSIAPAASQFLPGAAAVFETAADRILTSPPGDFDSSTPSAYSSVTVGTLGASNLAVNSQSATPFANMSAFSSTGFSGQSALPPQNGQSGTSGASGTNGSNGTNGVDGEGGGSTVTIINNTYIDNTTTIIDESVVNNLENITNNTVNEITDITDNIFTTINNVTNNVTDIITNILGGNPLDTGPIGISLDLTLDNLTNLTLDILNMDNVFNVINETIDLSPVLDPLSDLTGNIFANVGLDVTLDPFQYDHSPDDFDLRVGTDLNVLGLEIPDIGFDIPLDIVEGLLGDIDIDLNITEDLLGLGLLGGGGNADTDLGLAGLGLEPVTEALEGLINPVEDLVGDLDILGSLNLGLLGTDGNAPGTADTDIVLPINLGLTDGNILGNVTHISLDPLENLLGDIDLDLGVAGNILGNIAAPLIDGEAGGTGAHSPLSILGGALSGITGGLFPIASTGDTDLDIVAGIDLLDTHLLDHAGGLILDPVENLVGDLDIGANLGLGLLGTNTDTGTDTDISIPLDIALVDGTVLADGLHISLDPIEQITGDIDLDLGIAANLLGNMAANLFDSAAGGNGQDDLLSQLGNVVGDVVGTILPFNGGGENDLNLDFVADVAGVAGIDNAGALFLDPLETLTGDLDLALVDALNIEEIDLLNGLFDGGIGGALETATGLLDSLPENTGGLDLGALTSGLTDAASAIPTWTETLLPDAGSVFGGGLTSVIDNIIADPIAAIVPVIPLPLPALPILGFGGGNHSHGGLFG